MSIYYPKRVFYFSPMKILFPTNLDVINEYPALSALGIFLCASTRGCARRLAYPGLLYCALSALKKKTKAKESIIYNSGRPVELEGARERNTPSKKTIDHTNSSVSMINRWELVCITPKGLFILAPGFSTWGDLVFSKVGRFLRYWSISEFPIEQLRLSATLEELIKCIVHNTHLRCGFISSSLHLFISSSLHLFIPSFLHSFIPSFLHSFIPSFLHSFIPSFLHSKFQIPPALIA
ncbi:hypothetical protein QA601_06295 [Chitinispirillales bacterium ANBcel5]|uniref:hypothetical protein n=1 Tax=Cellulosispirillum alkaliphilum TaxID=3039283 RepID=UPI002A4F75C1|nr:hypothetical protein [Chitinispirillales bacterium ANBcel5]